jgi:hypothetical protein
MAPLPPYSTPTDLLEVDGGQTLDERHSPDTSRLAPGDREYPALDWSKSQNRLEEASYDVLVILDCCHAAAAVRKGDGTMEVLAGCARDKNSRGTEIYRSHHSLAIHRYAYHTSS